MAIRFFFKTFLFLALAFLLVGCGQSVMEGGSTPSAPASPLNFSAKAGNTEIALVWSKPEGAKEIKIVRKEKAYPSSSSNGVSVYQGGSRAAFVDKNLQNGTRYYYCAYAISDGGFSAPAKVNAKPLLFMNLKGITAKGTLESYINSFITCEGNVVIPAGKTLVIDNSTLQFISPADGKFGIYVYPGGILKIINDSLITAKNKEKGHYVFVARAGSTLEVIDSIIEETWSPNEGLNEAGLVVKTSHLIFKNSTARNSKGTGLKMIDIANIVIEGSTFEKNESSGIAIKNGENITIRNCLINTNKKSGLVLIDSSATIESCTIENNDTGIFSKNADLTLHKNTITNCTKEAVKIEGYPVPSLGTASSGGKNNISGKNTLAINNLSGTTIEARNNYWGTTDSVSLEVLFEGQVDYSDFLKKEP